MIPEAALRAAAEGSCIRYAAGLAAGYDPAEAHRFSPAFEQRIRKLRRRADHPVLLRASRRIAAAILALLLAGALWLAADREARAAFFGWVGELTGSGFIYHRDAGSVEEEDADYRPSWVPEGYTESSIKTIQRKTTVFYVNEKGDRLRFSYIQGSDEADWVVDTTQCEVLEAAVGGTPAQMFRSVSADTANAIIWNGFDSTAFFLSGYLSEEDLIRMAESVEKVT